MHKTIAGILAAAGLLTCLVTPVAYLNGAVNQPMFQGLFALGSIDWFVFATLFVSRK